MQKIQRRYCSNLSPSELQSRMSSSCSVLKAQMLQGLVCIAGKGGEPPLPYTAHRLGRVKTETKTNTGVSSLKS